MTRVSLSTTDARARAVDILKNSIARVNALKHALSDEYEALAVQDLDALTAATERKTTQVRELQALDNERNALCRETGFDNESEQMQKFTEWCDEDGVIEASWNELLLLAEHCNTQNLANGSVIRVRKQQIEDGISVLRGTDAESPTYDRHGGNRDGLGNRAIAEA